MTGFPKRSTTLATIAVGNDGEGPRKDGLNRIQVPSDCVNALAVGACDTIRVTLATLLV